MAHQEPRVLNVRMVIYPGSEGRERSEQYVINAIKNACRNLRDDTAVALAVYDEDGTSRGTDITGSLPSHVQRALEKALGIEIGAITNA